MAKKAAGVVALDVKQTTEQFLRDYKRSERRFSAWRKQAKMFSLTYANEPWPEGVKELMLAERRPASNFNFSLSTINTVLGQDMVDRREAQYQGVDGNAKDEFTGELYTIAHRQLYNLCNGHREESDAHLDQLLTGYGWCEGFLDASDFPILPAVSWVDCLEMYPDPDAKKPNLRDSNYVIHRQKWGLAEASIRWPEHKEKFEQLARPRGVTGENIFPQTAVSDDYQTRSGSGLLSDEEPTVWIYDHQRKRTERWVVYRDPRTDEYEQVPEADFEENLKELIGLTDESGAPLFQTPQDIDSVVIYKRVVYRAFYASANNQSAFEVEAPKRIREDTFTYKCATGYKGRQPDGSIIFFGLMSLIYEPQLWIAKALSFGLEFLARSNKGGGLIKERVLENPQAWLTNRSKIGYWAVAEDDANFQEDIWEERSPSWHQGFEKMLDIAIEVQPKITTVSDWLKGTATTERSNVLITNLQSQNQVALAPLADPLSAFRVELALLYANLIKNYVSFRDFNELVGDQECEDVTYTIVKDENTGQVMRGPDGKPQRQPITVQEEGEDQPREITPYDLIVEKNVFKFNVTVDLGAASVTGKQAIWQIFTNTAFIQKLIEVMPQLGRRILPTLLRNMPGLPAEEAKQLRKVVEEELEREDLQGTMEGLQMTLQELPPEALDQVAQMIQQFMAPPEGAPPEAGAAPAQ